MFESKLIKHDRFATVVKISIYRPWNLLNKIKDTHSDCLSSALQCLLPFVCLFVCLFFRDRVVRVTPTNKAQLQFLGGLEDNDDVSSWCKKSWCKKSWCAN